MIIKVSPVLKLQGSVELPASKSYSIRAFMIAACGGNSVIIAPSDCDDALVARDIAGFFGAKVVRSGKNSWKVLAAKKIISQSALNINVGESGTVLRFILPLLGVHAQRSIVSGKGTLNGRPNFHLIATLREMGMDISGSGKKESIPIKIGPSEIKGGSFNIDGSLSSQFISALLIACPQIKEDTFLKITGRKIVSSDYITMTRQVLKRTGIIIRSKGLRQYKISGGQRFQGLKDFHVPSDYGLAAFLMACGALVKSKITLNGYFDDQLIQADGRILDLLKRMSINFKRTSSAIKMEGPFTIKGGVFSLKDCPDLVPIMAVLALFAHGKTKLIDIAHARVKESDRLGDLARELRKVGAHIVDSKNSLTIFPKSQYKKNCLLDPHHDHRLAMAFAVLGLKIGVSIKDMECTHKSYPKFVRDFKRVIPKGL